MYSYYRTSYMQHKHLTCSFKLLMSTLYCWPEICLDKNAKQFNSMLTSNSVTSPKPTGFLSFTGDFCPLQEISVRYRGFLSVTGDFCPLQGIYVRYTGFLSFTGDFCPLQGFLFVTGDFCSLQGIFCPLHFFHEITRGADDGKVIVTYFIAYF